jgi:hypothetical protein
MRTSATLILLNLGWMSRQITIILLVFEYEPSYIREASILARSSQISAPTGTGALQIALDPDKPGVFLVYNYT